MRSAWCSLIASTRPGHVVERVAVRGEPEPHAVELRDEIERGEVRVQRVAVRRARDVRGDRRQHVVAGEQHPVLGVVEAEVVERVAGRVDREPVAPGEPDRRRRGAPGASGRAACTRSRMARIITRRLKRRHRVLAPAPRRGAAPRHRLALVLDGVLVGDRRRARGARRTTGRCRRAASSIASCSSRSASSVDSVAPFRSSDHVVNALCVMSSAPASCLIRPAPPKWSGCECVTITVWMSLKPKPAVARRVFSAFHDFGPGQARVDDGEASVVDEAVHVHVAEAGHPDRQLHPQHTGRDLGDLLGGRFLFLLLGSGPGRLGTGRPADAPRRSRPAGYLPAASVRLGHPEGGQSHRRVGTERGVRQGRAWARGGPARGRRRRRR